MKFQSEFKHFHWRKCIWRCRREMMSFLSQPQYVNNRLLSSMQSHYTSVVEPISIRPLKQTFENRNKRTISLIQQNALENVARKLPDIFTPSDVDYYFPCIRGGPRAEQFKVSSTSCGQHSFTHQSAKLWNEIPSILKNRPLYIFSNHVDRNGLDLNATVALVSFVRYTMYRYFYLIYFIFSAKLLGYTRDCIIFILLPIYVLVKLRSYTNFLIEDTMRHNFLTCVFNFLSFHQPPVFNHLSIHNL